MVFNATFNNISMFLLSGFVAHGEVCSIQHYVITFVRDLRRQVVGFLWVLRFPPTIKLTAGIHIMAYILRE
jgi:hypothetical protein